MPRHIGGTVVGRTRRVIRGGGGINPNILGRMVIDAFNPSPVRSTRTTIRRLPQDSPARRVVPRAVNHMGNVMNGRGMGMRSMDFINLRNAIRNESYGDDKVALIRMASRDNLFTAQQASMLLGDLSYSDNRMDALYALAPRLTDPENGFMIMAQFNSFDRDQARAILGY